MKLLAITLTLLGLFTASNTFTQKKGKEHLELFEMFGEIPQKMSAEDLKNHGQSGTKIPKKYYDLLDFQSFYGSYIVMIGKVEKGGRVILLYMTVEGKDQYNAGKVALTCKTLLKKDGEIDMSAHHILDVGLDGRTQYSGNFERDGVDYIIFNQEATEPDGKKTKESSKYKFGKYLEFDSHL